jgi:hypothetical protein
MMRVIRRSLRVKTMRWRISRALCSERGVFIEAAHLVSERRIDT